MHIAIMGGTGFIGSALRQGLLEQGYRVRILSRHAHFSHVDGPVSYAQWGVKQQGKLVGKTSSTRYNHEALATHLANVDAVINLAGAGIADARWTDARKHVLVTSRVHTTKALAAALASLPDEARPRTVLQCSAVGYYGSWGNLVTAPTCHEYRPADARPHAAADDFLAQLCVQWEEAIQSEALTQMGTRVAIMRIAPVLARNGGMLAKVMRPFSLYLGGPLGSGRQPLPWMHRHDTVAAMLHLLKHPHLHGPFNFTAPEAISMDQFCTALGRAMHRPSWLRVPAPVLKVVLGEMAEATILRGQVAPPERLMQSGFHHKYGVIEDALGEIL